MTRTNKWDGESHHKPRYFTHNHAYQHSPLDIKKNGAGKGNWGSIGSEIDDLRDDEEIPAVFNKDRRGSNHSQQEERFKSVQAESFQRLADEETDE